MRYINIEVEGKEYTLVDEFDDCGKEKVYYFAGDEDDIFCFKVDEKYIQIEDKKLIKKVEDKHNLTLPDILYKKKSISERVGERITGNIEIDDRTKEAFIDEVVGVLKGHFPDFDEDNAKKRLREVKIYITNKLPGKDGIMAYYSYRKDAMYFSKEDILSQDIKSKRTRLHETIHSLYYVENEKIMQELGTDVGKQTETLKTLKNKRITCFNEGATEELVESIYASDNKDITICNGDPDCMGVLSNDRSYSVLVSLIRQIKFITGRDTREFLFSGNNDIFQNTLAEKCGKDEVRLIRYVANKFVIIRDKKIDIYEQLKNEKKAIAEIQYGLLKSFDKEFNEEVNSVQTAEKFLSRLKGFDKLRICIKGNEDFKLYYSKKIGKICEMMQKQGISAGEIVAFEEKHGYKGWTENVYENKELKDYNINKKFFYYMSLKQNRKLDPNKVRFFYKLKNGVEFYGIMTENGSMLINATSYEKEDSNINNLPYSAYSVDDFEEIYWDEDVKKECKEYIRKKEEQEMLKSRRRSNNAKKPKSGDSIPRKNALSRISSFFNRGNSQKLLPETTENENMISNRDKRESFIRRHIWKRKI